MINARAETVDEKRSFAAPLKSRRCLVLADGYFEWQRIGGTKQACWITPSDGGLLLFAGLWESNRRLSETELKSCTIITTAANDQLRDIHDRMPVALHGEAAQRWLAKGCDAQEAKSLLAPVEDGFMKVTRVGSYVNNVKHDSPKCIAAA